MKNDENPCQSEGPEGHTECKPKRLAESAFVAVDGCACGNMLIHIGPVTVRMDPHAVSALLGTLGQAVVKQSAMVKSNRRPPRVHIFNNKKRGSA